MKFSGKVWSDHGTTCLNFGSIRVNWSSGQIKANLFVITGHSSESVAFARWQQGRGLLCPAPQLVLMLMLSTASKDLFKDLSLTIGQCVLYPASDGYILILSFYATVQPS